MHVLHVRREGHCVIDTRKANTTATWSLVGAFKRNLIKKDEGSQHFMP